VDSRNSGRLKNKYTLYLSILFIISLGVFYLLWENLHSLFQVFGIDEYASGEPGDSLNKYDYLVLIVLVFTFFISYLATALITGLLCKWTVKQSLDRLVNFKNLPRHWYKS
jgi:ABC-type phosphate transport system permease subunit